MHKLVLILAPMLSAAAPETAGQLSDTALLTLSAGLSCIAAADKKQASTSRFEVDPVWTKSRDGLSFKHQSMPILIVFPRDKDGVARICEVQATLESQAEVTKLKAAIQSGLKRKPHEQSDSTIWLFDTKDGPRGLQLFPDNASNQPAIRLIGAAF